MITILVDYNLEGQAVLLSGAYTSEGWAELFPLRFLKFKDVGLSHESNDREVWRFAQASQMILLTGNRNMKGEASLEQTLREENSPTSLSVLTIGDVERVAERRYRERCVTRLVEIVSDLENYLGASRLFIP